MKVSIDCYANQIKISEVEKVDTRSRKRNAKEVMDHSARRIKSNDIEEDEIEMPCEDILIESKIIRYTRKTYVAHLRELKIV